MNYNVIAMKDILPLEEIDNIGYHSNDLQNLMQKFREEEKAANVETKAFRKARKSHLAIDVKIDFICPSCDNYLGKVVQPSRRSKRKCKVCGLTIHVEPQQSLFKSPFLSEKQAFLSDTLKQLNHWVFTNGSIRDFGRVKKNLGMEGHLDDGQITQVLRVLILKAIDKTKTDAEEAYRAYKDMTTKIDRELKAAGIDWPSSMKGPDYSLQKMVEKLLVDFDNVMTSDRKS